MKMWSTNGKVYSIDVHRLEQSPRQKSINHICSGPYINEYPKIAGEYPNINHNEDNYQKIEDDYGKIIVPILNNATQQQNPNAFIFNQKEKELLLLFVATLAVRNPNYDIRDLVQELCSKCFGPIKQKIDNDLGNCVSNNFLEEMVEHAIKDYTLLNCPPMSCGGMAIRDILNFLQDKCIYILGSKEKAFCFSDNPVLINDKGLYCPLSPDIAITIHVRNYYGDGEKPNRLIWIHPHQVYELNSNYIHLNKCVKYLYAIKPHVLQGAKEAYYRHGNGI